MKTRGRGTQTGVTTTGQSDADGAVRVSGSYDFTAPAEVVFGVLTDPDRTSRWLPRGMNTASATGDQVRPAPHGAVGQFVADALAEAVPDRHVTHGLRLSGRGGPRRPG